MDKSQLATPNQTAHDYRVLLSVLWRCWSAGVKLPQFDGGTFVIGNVRHLAMSVACPPAPSHSPPLFTAVAFHVGRTRTLQISRGQLLPWVCNRFQTRPSDTLCVINP